MRFRLCKTSFCTSTLSQQRKNVHIVTVFLSFVLIFFVLKVRYYLILKFKKNSLRYFFVSFIKVFFRFIFLFFRKIKTHLFSFAKSVAGHIRCFNFCHFTRLNASSAIIKIWYRRVKDFLITKLLFDQPTRKGVRLPPIS